MDELTHRPLGMDTIESVFGTDACLEILAQDSSKRVSQVLLRYRDNIIAAHNVVFFSENPPFPQIHKEILEGYSIGHSFRSQGVRIDREERCSFVYVPPSSIREELKWKDEKKGSFCKVVDIKVGQRKIPYARIVELYHPQVPFPKLHERVPNSIDFGIATLRDSFEIGEKESEGYIIKAVEEWDLRQYLELAFEFVGTERHTGVTERRDFLQKTEYLAKRLLADQNTTILAAERGNDLVAYLAANIHPALHVLGKEAMVRELYVTGKHRRQGIGTSLLDVFEAMAAEQGAQRVSLATNWETQEQRGFYESRGFQRRCDFVVKSVPGLPLHLVD